MVRAGWLVAALVGIVAGCASEPTRTAAGDGPVEYAPGQCVPDRGWLIPATGAARSTHEILSDFGQRDVVLLGEIHDSQAHHDWQASVAGALASRGRPVVIGLEMLPRSAQPALDAWVAGSLSESEFLSRAGWADYWRFDHTLYMPILRLAQLHRIPVYALNVERKLVEDVRARGWGALSATEREGLVDPAAAPEDYQRMLAESFALHDRHGKHGEEISELTDERFTELRNQPTFQRFVEGQLLWDAAMAQRIAQLRRDHPAAQVIAIMGSGHMMDGNGVPHQLRSLGIDSVAALLPWDDDFPCEMLTAKLGDAVYGIKSTPVDIVASSKPRLGIHIENHSGGVKVTKVEDGSIAAAAGLVASDVIVEIAGRGAPKVEDIVQAVQAMAPGTWLPVTVARAEQQIDLVAKFPAQVP